MDKRRNQLSPRR